MRSSCPWEGEVRDTPRGRKAPVGVLVALLLVTIFFRMVPPAGAANPRRSPVVEVVDKVRPAVVNIQSERPVKNPAAARPRRKPGQRCSPG